MCTVDRLCEDELCLVGEVGALLVDDIRKSVHKLHFWNELEKGQIEITAQSCFQINVRVLKQILLLFLDCEVECRCDTCHHVGAVIVESFSCELHIDGNRDVGRFDGLKLLFTVGFVAECEVLRAKMQSGDDAQPQMLGQIELTQNSYGETWLITGRFGKPLVAVFVDIAILLQLNVLQVHASQKAVVELALVNVGTVHHLPLLCISGARRRRKQQQKCYKIPYYIIMCRFHQFIKREKPRFILQKAEITVTFTTCRLLLLGKTQINLVVRSLNRNFATKLSKLFELTKQNMKLTVIGAGNMGGALIKGWAKSGKVESITIADKNEPLLAQFKQEYPSLRTTTDNVEAVKDADVIVLVVKPWLMKMVLAEVKHALNLEKQIIISDAANFTTSMLEEELGAEGQYFYVIPNIAAEFGASMSFIAQGPSATEESLKTVEALYAIDGDTLVVGENLVGPGMMMASCGIAYVMRYIRAQMEGGCEMGFYPQQAKQIALQTMQGAVSLLKATGWHPEEAIDKVTTPGGVTIKGLNELDHAGFNSAVIRSLKAGLK